ncbi:MAG TPA: SCO2521 family protein [Phytomonospora sp.]
MLKDIHATKGKASAKMITVGEVHTGLLQHSSAISGQFTADLLTLVRGDRVRTSERPIAHAVSPERLTGVDCGLPTGSGGSVRGIGTAVTRALLTGGHLLQGSTFAEIVPSEHRRRMPWSHYLARPGVIEYLGRADDARLAKGFCDSSGVNGAIDLGSISGRIVDEVQFAAPVDRRPPFRSSRTRLRWAVEHGGPHATMVLSIDDSVTRTARVRAGDSEVPDLAALCEDIAVHDWLLTTVLGYVERARIGTGERAGVVRALQPVIDHMLHLWMPAARLKPEPAALWDDLERRPGFTRQWNTLISRIRDQMMLATIASGGGHAGEA